MTRDARHIAIVAVLAILIALLGGVAGWCMRGNMRGGEKHPLPVSDTVFVTQVDTVTLVGPIDTLDRIVWRPYPVAVHDTTLITSHTTDSVFISLPYQYRHLSKPDTLDVWYSGVDPRIDSIKFYNRENTKIIRQPYEVAKMPRLTLDLGAAAVYFEKSINPLLFLETRYNTPQTTWQIGAAVNHEGKWGIGGGVSYRFNIMQ